MLCNKYKIESEECHARDVYNIIAVLFSVFSPFVTANSILRIISVYFSFLVFNEHCETKTT